MMPASRGTLELNDIAFSGDVRSLAGSIRGDGNFMLSGTRYPFRVSSGQTADGNGTRVHLNIDPGPARALGRSRRRAGFEARAPRFEGAVTLASSAWPKDGGNEAPPPWRITSKVKADYSAARLEALEMSYGAEERALKLAGNGDIRFGASPLLRAALSARQLDADRFFAKDSKDNAAEPVRALPALRALMSRHSACCRSRRRSNSPPSRSCWADVRCRTSPPNCMATANPGACASWISARRARPGSR